MKKLLFLALLVVFSVNLTSAQVFMSRGEVDELTRSYNDFTMNWEAYMASKGAEGTKELSKGIFKLAGKIKTYNYQFERDSDPIAPKRTDLNIKLREIGADFTDPYNQVVGVSLSSSDLEKMSQHSANMTRLKEEFRQKRYKINLGDQEMVSQLESFKNSARICLEIQKTAFLQAYNERN